MSSRLGVGSPLGWLWRRITEAADSRMAGLNTRYGWTRLADHRVSKSIYLTDPDGHGLELFVDTDPAIWREDPAAVATVEPLEL